VWGVLVGLLVAALPWIVVGDPAGNFDGLIELSPDAL